MLALELKWRRAHPDYPPNQELPADVLRQNFHGTLMDNYLRGVMTETGLQPDPDHVQISHGQYETVRDYLMATAHNHNPWDEGNDDPSRAQRRADNARELERFRNELAKTDPETARAITLDTPIYARYYVTYPVRH
jgi:hypothetical protein